MQLLKFYIGNGIDGFDDSDISHMVHILFIWTSYMVRLGFISCSFELHMWFIMKITEVALLLAWTPVVTQTQKFGTRGCTWPNSCDIIWVWVCSWKSTTGAASTGHLGTASTVNAKILLSFFCCQPVQSFALLTDKSSKDMY